MSESCTDSICTTASFPHSLNIYWEKNQKTKTHLWLKVGNTSVMFSQVIPRLLRSINGNCSQSESNYSNLEPYMNGKPLNSNIMTTSLTNICEANRFWSTCVLNLKSSPWRKSLTLNKSYFNALLIIQYLNIKF